jgi:hypothetical protein
VMLARASSTGRQVRGQGYRQAKSTHRGGDADGYTSLNSHRIGASGGGGTAGGGSRRALLLVG